MALDGGVLGQQQPLTDIEAEGILKLYASISRQEQEAKEMYNQVSSRLRGLEQRRQQMQEWLLDGGVVQERLDNALKGSIDNDH